ncbi:MAG: redoxin family protein [Burkholderiaceae bacterium]
MRSHFAARLWTRTKPHLGTVAIALGALIAVHLWQTRDIPSGPAPALSFTLLQADGSETRTTLAQWQNQHPGEPVAIYVWADWCPICKAMAPNVQTLTKSRPVLTVAMQSGPSTKVATVLRQRQTPWPTAVDTNGEIARALGVKVVPAYLTLDSQGQIRNASVGYTTTIGMRARLVWASLF